MKIIRGIDKIKKFKKPVVALGVFDGVHRGHRVILKAAAAKARNIHGTSVIVTFCPHPQKQESLSSLEHRLNLIKELGLDYAIVINFNKKFASMPAVDFVKNILVNKIGVRYIYIGENFRFGKNAEGDCQTLKILSRKYDFELKVFKEIRINNKAVSSTYIRGLIKNGQIIKAKNLLLRPVSILGTVIRGASFASSLGFPTANIDPHHEVIPPDGVYAVRIIFAGRKYDGACYIGPKPGFLDNKIKTKALNNIEVFIFNFRKNIYGRDLEVQFLKKIRKARKFNSIHELAAQIKKDILAIDSRHNMCR